MKPNPSTHGGKGWGCALWGATPRSWQGHLKVTARSNQLKLGRHSLFVQFLLQLFSFEISMMVVTYLGPSTKVHQKTP